MKLLVWSVPFTSHFCPRLTVHSHTSFSLSWGPFQASHLSISYQYFPIQASSTSIFIAPSYLFCSFHILLLSPLTVSSHPQFVSYLPFTFHSLCPNNFSQPYILLPSLWWPPPFLLFTHTLFFIFMEKKNSPYFYTLLYHITWNDFAPCLSQCRQTIFIPVSSSASTAWMSKAQILIPSLSSHRNHVIKQITSLPLWGVWEAWLILVLLGSLFPGDSWDI